MEHPIHERIVITFFKCNKSSFLPCALEFSLQRSKQDWRKLPKSFKAEARVFLPTTDTLFGQKLAFCVAICRYFLYAFGGCLSDQLRNCCKPHERAPPSPPSFYKSPTFLVCYFEASFYVKKGTCALLRFSVFP